MTWTNCFLTNYKKSLNYMQQSQEITVQSIEYGDALQCIISMWGRCFVTHKLCSHFPIDPQQPSLMKSMPASSSGVHITDVLKWSTHTESVVKKAQQCLFNLRRLKKFGLAAKTLTNFYRCTIENILSGCITGWYGNRRALQRVVQSAKPITGGTLPALQDTYRTRCYRKDKKIIKDINHLSHGLFTPLPSRRRGQYRYIKLGPRD